MKEARSQTALSKKFPEPVAVVTCSGGDGKENIITVGWFMQTSLEPVLLAISIGKTRFSHDLILNSNEFVLCFPSAEQASAVLYCGTHTGRNVDKFAETGLKKIKARHVDAPLIADSVSCFECKVVNKLETGDHTIFIGEVLIAYESNDCGKGMLYDFGNCVLKGLGHN